MRGVLIFTVLLGMIFPVALFASEVDVMIKGMDDGIKSNKQQDHAEAVMNAKIQAMERAGVEIQSITQVANFQMKSKMVESKADAVLLPGFQIMDLGYQTDGTYLVVLYGKVRQKGDDISSKELHYIKSLVDRSETSKAKDKLFDLIKTSKEDATVAEAMYLSVEWEFTVDPVDTFDRMKAYYPGSQYVGKLKSLLDERREEMESFGLVRVKGGCFQMGDLFGDGDGDEKPVHEVCVDGFNIGKYEVTQGQWQKVMGTSPANFKSGDNHPVEQVSWNDVQGFIDKLKAKTGKNYRLPTEAEWEYACRSGGKKEKYCGGNDLDALAWHGGNSGNKTHPVGTKQPNGLGLYDMSGNVYEWTGDWYGEKYYGSSPKNDPAGPSSGSGRVFRGGGWNSRPGCTHAASRGRHMPGGHGYGLGFRFVLPPDQVSER